MSDYNKRKKPLKLQTLTSFEGLLGCWTNDLYSNINEETEEYKLLLLMDEDRRLLIEAAIEESVRLKSTETIPCILLDDPFTFVPPKIIFDSPKFITDIRLANQKILERINRNPYEMYNLSPRQFEIMCAELFEERGVR